jgi:hypothetical protein
MTLISPANLKMITDRLNPWRRLCNAGVNKKMCISGEICGRDYPVSSGASRNGGAFLVVGPSKMSYLPSRTCPSLPVARARLGRWRERGGLVWVPPRALHVLRLRTGHAGERKLRHEDVLSLVVGARRRAVWRQTWNRADTLFSRRLYAVSTLACVCVCVGLLLGYLDYIGHLVFYPLSSGV